MPRPIWSGAISFGLVNIPVKLVTATREKDVHFHQLHKADNVRVRYKVVCPAEEKEVPREQIVKGYEVAAEQYVLSHGRRAKRAGNRGVFVLCASRACHPARPFVTRDQPPGMPRSPRGNCRMAESEHVGWAERSESHQEYAHTWPA